MADLEKYVFSFKDRDCPRIEYEVSSTMALAENNRGVRERWGQLVGPIVRILIPLPTEPEESAS